jgi:hypothetical protein
MRETVLLKLTRPLPTFFFISLRQPVVRQARRIYLTTCSVPRVVSWEPHPLVSIAANLISQNDFDGSSRTLLANLLPASRAG